MRRITVLFAFLAATYAFAGDPITICVAQPAGTEARNWKLQTPIAKRLEAEALEKQVLLTAPLLASDDEKHARSEGREKSCSYVLLLTWETKDQQIFGTFNPSPTGRSTVDVNRTSALTTSAGLSLKYKIITMEGKKIGTSSVPLTLKDQPAQADYEEAGRKLVAAVATQVLAALAK